MDEQAIALLTEPRDCIDSIVHCYVGETAKRFRYVVTDTVALGEWREFVDPLKPILNPGKSHIEKEIHEVFVRV